MQNLSSTNQPDTGTQVTSLGSRCRELGSKVDQWNNWMVASLILAFLAAAAVLITTRMVVLRSRQLARTQDELQNALGVEASETRLRLEKDLAAQQERTANAEAQLLKLQLKISDREITQEQVAQVLEFVKNKQKGEVIIQRLSQDPEAVAYSQKIYDLLQAAGWAPVFPPGKAMGIDPGLHLSIYSAEALPNFRDKDGMEAIPSTSAVYYGKVLKDAFSAAKIPIANYLVKSGPPIPRDSVYIAVGQKP